MFVTKRKVRKTLIKARDHILEQGWTQGSYWKPIGDGTLNGPVCAMGALNYAIHGRPTKFDHNSLRVKAEDALCSVYGESVIVFNDGRGTTKEDVIELFNRAIKEL